MCNKASGIDCNHTDLYSWLHVTLSTTLHSLTRSLPQEVRRYSDNSQIDSSVYRLFLNHYPPPILLPVLTHSSFLNLFPPVLGVPSLPRALPSHHSRGTGAARAKSQNLSLLHDGLRQSGTICVWRSCLQPRAMRKGHQSHVGRNQLWETQNLPGIHNLISSSYCWVILGQWCIFESGDGMKWCAEN